MKCAPAAGAVVYSIYCLISERLLSSRSKEVALYRGAISNPLKRTQEKPEQMDGRAEESDGVAGGGDRGGGVRPHFSRRR